MNTEKLIKINKNKFSIIIYIINRIIIYYLKKTGNTNKKQEKEHKLKSEENAKIILYSNYHCLKCNEIPFIFFIMVVLIWIVQLIK